MVIRIKPETKYKAPKEVVVVVGKNKEKIIMPAHTEKDSFLKWSV